VRYALEELAERGKDSGVLLQYTDQELVALKEPVLRELMSRLWDYKRRVTYVGKRAPAELAKLIDQKGKNYLEAPARRPLIYQRPGKDTVLFTHRDMLQSQIGLFAADEVMDPEHAVDYQFLAGYLGGGMSSIIFQEIRESRALAYAASGGYAGGSNKGDESRLWGFLGTQADKTLEATRTLRDLLRTPPLTEKQFSETAKSIEESYRTNPVNFRAIPGTILAWENQGLAGDPRPQRFERVQKYTLADLAAFSQRFAQRPLTVSILGNRDRLDLEGLKKLGSFEEITLDRIFPY
jgi:predicted Zn-dependent peptidase